MQTWSQPQSGYAGSRTSPIGIGGAIAVHAVAIGIFLLMPKEMIDRLTPTTLSTYPVRMDPPPPDQNPPKQLEQKDDLPIRSMPTEIVPTIIPLTADTAPTFVKIPPIDFVPGGGTVIDTKPPIAPILVDAQADYGKGAFQPNYPPAMRRQDQEGKVTVRVHIGADGRVLDVEKVFATTEAFWKATQDQAIKKWRFLPATSDGTPVESVRVMTVYFKLET